jgi:hypothetical protein
VVGLCAGNPKKLFGFSSKSKLTTKIRSIKQYSEVANTLQLIAFVTESKKLKVWIPLFAATAKTKDSDMSEPLYWVMGQTFCRHLWSLHSRSEHTNLWLLDKEVVVSDHCHLVYVSVIKWVTKSFMLLFVNTGKWILSGWYSCSFRGLKYPDFIASRISCLWITVYKLSHSNPISGGWRFIVWGSSARPHWRRHTIRNKRTRHITGSLERHVENTWRDGRRNSKCFYEISAKLRL